MPTADDASIHLERTIAGDPVAKDALLVAVYNELRAVAARRLAKERADHTLDPTALVHEAYLRLVSSDAATPNNQRHFFALAARSIRRVLVDHARARRADRAGGGRDRVTLVTMPGEEDTEALELLDLDEILGQLEERSPRQAEVVHLRFFAGLSVAETAEVLSLSEMTIKNDWRAARAWLLRWMSEKDRSDGGSDPGTASG